MPFPNISSRGGLVANNSTIIQNNLLRFNMSQDDVADLNNMLEAALEATSKGWEENRRKKNEHLEASRKESRCKKTPK